MWVNRLTAGEKFLSRVSATNKLCKTYSWSKINQNSRLYTTSSIKYFWISTRTLSSKYPSKPGSDRRQEQLESSPQLPAACPIPSLEAGQRSLQPPALSTSSFAASFLPRRTPAFSVNSARNDCISCLRRVGVVEGEPDGLAPPDLLHLQLLPVEPLLHRHLQSRTWVVGNFSPNLVPPGSSGWGLLLQAGAQPISQGNATLSPGEKSALFPIQRRMSTF